MATDLAAEVAQGALVVDTRPAEQRDRDGDLPGAVVIDRNVLEWRLDPTRAVVVRGVLGRRRLAPRAGGSGLMRVGDVARRTRRVEADDIERFAAMTGDRNPLHVDAALAARSRFGGIVVQGGVTSGLLNAVVAQDLPGPGSVFLQTTCSYRAPVRPGDVITAEVEVLDLRTDKPISTLRTTITNDAGTVVLDGTAVVWRDPVVAAATDPRP